MLLPSRKPTWQWKRPVSKSAYILKLCTFHCQILVSRNTDGKPLNLSEFCASPLPKEVCSLVVAKIQCALRESSYDYSVGRLFLLVFHQRKPSFTTSPPLHLTRGAYDSRTLLFIPCFIPRDFFAFVRNAQERLQQRSTTSLSHL